MPPSSPLELKVSSPISQCILALAIIIGFAESVSVALARDVVLATKILCRGAVLHDGHHSLSVTPGVSCPADYELDIEMSLVEWNRSTASSKLLKVGADWEDDCQRSRFVSEGINLSWYVPIDLLLGSSP